MHQAVIYIDPVGPAPVGFAQAAGMPGDIRFDFKTQGNLAYPDIASLYPQLVLRPFTRPDIHAYDIEINDPTGASGIAKVPGVVMNDRFSIEVYSRDVDRPAAADARRRPGRPDRLRLRHDRTARPRQLPDGPRGPCGARWCDGRPGGHRRAGPARIALVHRRRGSCAVPDERVAGDMWLDETNGDVWRWDGTTWRGYVRRDRSCGTRKPTSRGPQGPQGRREPTAPCRVRQGRGSARRSRALRVRPGTTDWTGIANKPSTFPPDPEAVDDRVAALLVAGSNITLTYDDAGNALTVASTASGGGGGTPGGATTDKFSITTPGPSAAVPT